MPNVKSTRHGSRQTVDPKSDPKFDPKFDPKYDPTFDPKVNPKCDQTFDPQKQNIDPKFDQDETTSAPQIRATEPEKPNHCRGNLRGNICGFCLEAI